MSWLKVVLKDLNVSKEALLKSQDSGRRGKAGRSDLYTILVCAFRILWGSDVLPCFLETTKIMPLLGSKADFGLDMGVRL